MYEELVHPKRLGAALARATDDDRWVTPEVELIRGGKSNLTFWLRSDAGELVLRRPPTGELLPSAHDMLREARVQTALAKSDVPVPRIVLVDDGALITVLPVGRQLGCVGGIQGVQFQLSLNGHQS